MKLWILRALVPLGGHFNLSEHPFQNSDLARAVGLSRWVDGNGLREDRKEILGELRAQHRRAEARSSRAASPKALRTNVLRIAGLVGLSDLECRVLEFAILHKMSPLLVSATDLLGNLTSVKAFRVISVLLDLPPADVSKALAPQALLAQSGLLRIDRSQPNELDHKLNLLSENFADYMTTPASDPMRLVRDIITASPQPTLALEDFGHIAPLLDIMLPFLRRSVAESRSGTNVFIYGPPGTGKTQLARIMAATVGCSLYEVASEDFDGTPVGGTQRLSALRTALSFLGQGMAMAAFDEAEDVFGSELGFFGRRSVAQSHKAWVNRLLEGNRLPVIWLSNDVHSLDPAFIRRFDFVIELPVPPKRQRERMIRRASDGLLAEAGVKRLAESELLSPAIVSRAASVVSLVREAAGEDYMQDAMEMLVGNTLEAQGHPRPRREDPNRLPETYDPAYVTADADLAALTDGLASSRSGRLCLYGPPGTGKTAYGRWIAERLDMPLEVRRASDLLSKWLGESEKNIARAFRRAEQSRAILLIDEVDSFLQDRRGAHRNWEVAQVNEMLTQMESFAGIFIASTNLVDGLDQAALRRFDLKVQFGFLVPHQAWRLFQQTCLALRLETPTPALEAAVSRMEVLTPGDFAAVQRQSRFRPLTSALDLVRALEAECVLKTGGRRRLGY